MADFDAIVIGAGQGGSPLAHKLADLGQRVAIIEREFLGGSCINYGCTPTKSMLASARIAQHARRGPTFGVHAGDVRVDMNEVVERKNRIVLDWREGQLHHIETRPTITLFRGHGRFAGPHAVEVNGERLTSERIFINTGNRPRIPPIEGLEEAGYFTNRNVMDLDAVPGHLIVLGGNYMGLEFGQMFRRFGSEVTVIEINDQIVPREDPEVAQALRDALEGEGMRFVLGAQARKVSGRTGAIGLTLDHKDGGAETVTGTHLLVATGQRANSDDMNLDRAGIETDEHGYIRHNGRLETTAPGVWVIGDAKGGPAFTHISYDDHLVIYANLIEGKDRNIDRRVVPYALYTDPELGRVGMTEKEARAAGYRLKIGSVPTSYIARAIERDETAGIIKIVINAENDRILGAAFLSAEGGDLVQVIMTLMLADQPWTLFHRAMFIHPTLAEGFFSLMDSVKAA